MTKTNSTLPGILIGGLCGGVIGGLTLAVPALFDNSPGGMPFGSPRSMAPLFFVVGAFFGVIHGAFAGLIIAAVNAGKVSASLIGAAVALLVAGYILMDSRSEDRELQIIAALCLPLGALVGLLTSILLGLRRKNGKRPA